MSECLASPAVRNTSKRAHEPLPRELDHEQRDWGAERQGEQWVRFLEGMKGTWILLTALWTLSNNLPMGSWEVLTHQSPQMVQELPQLLLCMKHIRPHPGLVSCLDSQQQGQSKPCLIASECPQKADPNVLAKEWHLGFFFYHLWENETKTISTWPGVLQDPGKAYKLRNSVEKRSKRHGSAIPIESLR